MGSQHQSAMDTTKGSASRCIGDVTTAFPNGTAIDGAIDRRARWAKAKRRTRKRSRSSSRRDPKRRLRSPLSCISRWCQKEKEAEKDALAEMRRMSRRISCNLSVAHHFQQRTTTALNNVQKTVIERRSVPIGSTLQIGVGVDELTNVMEVRRHRIEMDAEEDLAGFK